MKRRLLTIAIFLLAGAVVNVALAWGCALCVDVYDVGTYKGATAVTTEEHWTLDIWSCAGAKFIHSLRQRGSFTVTVEATPDDLLPYWSKLAIPSTTYATGLSDFEKHIVEARGWPLLALWCELSMTSGAGLSYSVAGAIETPWQWKSNLRPRTLPLRPISTGFAINTIFYATFLWLLTCLAIALRRFLRLRRGLCPACGYDLRHGEHQACPECGVTA